MSTDRCQRQWHKDGPLGWKGEEDEVGTASWSEGADRPKTCALEEGQGWEVPADVRLPGRGKKMSLDTRRYEPVRYRALVR